MIQGTGTITRIVWAVALATGLAASHGFDGRDAGRHQRLARDVERAEGIRAVKTLQRSFAQYGQFGLWNEMAGLFSRRRRLYLGRRQGQRRKSDR